MFMYTYVYFILTAKDVTSIRQFEVTVFQSMFAQLLQSTLGGAELSTITHLYNEISTSLSFRIHQTVKTKAGNRFGHMKIRDLN